MDLYSEALVTDEADVFGTSPIRSAPKKRKTNKSEGGEDIEIDKVAPAESEDNNTMENDMKELKNDVKELTGHMKIVIAAIERFEELTKRVDKNEKNVKKVEEDVKKIDVMVKDGIVNVNELQSSNEKLKKRLKVLEDKMGSQEEKNVNLVQKMEDRVTRQEEKSVDLEARSRRNNLVFHSVREKEGETDDDCKEAVLKIIRDKCKVRKPVIIQRAHRIPPGPHNARSDNKPRPLIVNFHDFNDRVAVKAGRKNIPADCDIGVSDDLPLAIRAARRRLHSELESYKSENRDSYILYPAKLYVDGHLVREEPIRAEDNVRRKDSRDPRPRSRREGDVRREGRRDYSSRRRDDSRYRQDDRSRDRSRFESHRNDSGRDGAWRTPRHTSRRYRNGYNGHNTGYP